MKSKLAIILLLSIALTNCMDLDRFPSHQFTEGTFWQSNEDARKAIMGVYKVIKDDYAFGLLFMYDCLSDINTAHAGIAPIARGVYDGRNGYVVGKWNYCFEGVQRANYVISMLKKDNQLISEEVRNKIIGEAKFLRALFYFHLADYFGGVPLYDETTDVPKNYSKLLKPRATIDETYTFILNDLNDAVSILPTAWEKADHGRATKGAAYALRGKVNLYAKNYTEGLADFNEIVNDPSGQGYGYKLHNNYAELFNKKGDSSNEIIFAIQNIGNVGERYGMKLAWYLGTRSCFEQGGWNLSLPSVKLGEMYELKDGRPFNWDEFIPGFTGNNSIRKETFYSTLTADGKGVASWPKYKDDLLAMYEQRDSRMKETIILPYTYYLGWINNAPKNFLYVMTEKPETLPTNGFVQLDDYYKSYAYRKFVPEGNMDGLLSFRTDTPINFPLLRFADVLLMMAECENELGKVNDAVKHINMVRSRPSVNMPSLNSGPEWLKATTKEEVFQRIIKERAIELAGEGLRFSDLRRWELAKDYLNGKPEMELVTPSSNEPLYIRQFLDRDYLWPIPTVEIEMNPELKQNPGW